MNLVSELRSKFFTIQESSETYIKAERYFYVIQIHIDEVTGKKTFSMSRGNMSVRSNFILSAIFFVFFSLMAYFYGPFYIFLWVISIVTSLIDLSLYFQTVKFIEKLTSNTSVEATA